MSIIDDLRQAIAASPKLDAGAKSIVSEFLQTAGPSLETLAPAVVNDILNSFASGNGAAATAAISDTLSEDQVASTLGGIEQQMQTALAERTAQVAATRATTAALQTAALTVLSRLLISAL
jgi:hypothetical protein